jgi:hypothetical protein
MHVISMRKIGIGLPLIFLIPLVLVSTLAVGSFAATVGVTTSAVEEDSGVLLNVVGGFSVACNGFLVVQSLGSASTQPMAWSNGAGCQTALVTGHWCYSLTLTIAESAQASHTYTMTVSWNTGSGYSTMGTLTFTSPASITPGETMNFLIDTGVTSFNAPAALTITVA